MDLLIIETVQGSKQIQCGCMRVIVRKAWSNATDGANCASNMGVIVQTMRESFAGDAGDVLTMRVHWLQT